MAYFDFVNSGSSMGYGLVYQGYEYDIGNTTSTEKVVTFTPTADTRYIFHVNLDAGGNAYVPYLKIELNGSEIANITEVSGFNGNSYKIAEVYVKSGDTITAKLKSYKTGMGNNHIWICE